MDLISILIVLIIVGAILYGVTLLPIDGTFKTIIRIAAIVLVAIWLLKQLGPIAL